MPVTQNNNIKIDDVTKLPMFETQWREYTCSHIAHHEAWKKHLREKEERVIQQLVEYVEGADTPKKNKRNKKQKRDQK